VKGGNVLVSVWVLPVIDGQGDFYRPGGGRITMSYYFYIHEGFYMTSGA
jgi:hypothetical protein